jgi:hypothetical protein
MIAQELTKYFDFAGRKRTLGDYRENKGSIEEHEDVLRLQIPDDAVPFHLRLCERGYDVNAFVRNVGCEVVLEPFIGPVSLSE